jgi:hypothetical protein
MKERHTFTLFLFKHTNIILICSFGIIKQLLPSYEGRQPTSGKQFECSPRMKATIVYCLIFNNIIQVMPAAKMNIIIVHPRGVVLASQG